jgi:hypothetical protein
MRAAHGGRGPDAAAHRCATDTGTAFQPWTRRGTLFGARAAPRTSAPSCITTWVDDGSLTDTAYARNDCGSQQRIKILWAFDTDGPCTTVSPGGTIWSRRAYPARFDGVDSC